LNFYLCRPCVTRMLSMTSPLNAKPRKPPDDDDDNDKASKPIQFSTSKASHRTWRVDRSMGSTYQRPWWKVLPISVIGVGFLVWCMFRKESEIDDSRNVLTLPPYYQLEPQDTPPLPQLPKQK
uniref:Si:ch211-231f6.6 n=1 Tax=Cyprinus carpio TaxID=7962 RepID=A0A8C1ZSJ4_CYPCA